MAHYAELDENNIVIRVIVINNSDELKDGIEDELTGVAFCAALTGRPSWKKTSYNNNIRKRYASIGYKYDATKDVFIEPQPFPSWTLDENSDWQAPTPKPEDNNMYVWDESTLSWLLIEIPPQNNNGA